MPASRAARTKVMTAVNFLDQVGGRRVAKTFGGAKRHRIEASRR